jgi:hypothetical protein
MTNKDQYLQIVLSNKTNIEKMVDLEIKSTKTDQSSNKTHKRDYQKIGD